MAPPPARDPEYDSRSVSDDPPYALPKDTRVKEYKIKRVLGRGGFGITYLVHDLNLKGPVALKEYFPAEYARRVQDGSVRPISPESRANFDWGRKRFVEEAQTLHRLRHPNVVRVLQCFEAHGTAYIVMEHIKGRPLEKILAERERLPAAEWKSLLDQLLNGLEHVHEHGYLHRDVKPGNIMIRDHGAEPVFIDFGSARVDAQDPHTRVLTEAYAPLEQGMGEKEGPPTDLYSLAVVSYRALLGKLPPKAQNRAVEDTIARLEQRVTGAERAWLAALDQCLNLYPRDRPQSVANLREMLAKPAGASDRMVTPLWETIRHPVRAARRRAVRRYGQAFDRKLEKHGSTIWLIEYMGSPYDGWKVIRRVEALAGGEMSAVVSEPMHTGARAGRDPLFERRVATEEEGLAWLYELETNGRIAEAARERIESWRSPRNEDSNGKTLSGVISVDLRLIPLPSWNRRSPDGGPYEFPTVNGVRVWDLGIRTTTLPPVGTDGVTRFSGTVTESLPLVWWEVEWYPYGAQDGKPLPWYLPGSVGFATSLEVRKHKSARRALPPSLAEKIRAWDATNHEFEAISFRVSGQVWAHGKHAPRTWQRKSAPGDGWWVLAAALLTAASCVTLWEGDRWAILQFPSMLGVWILILWKKLWRFVSFHGSGLDFGNDQSGLEGGCGCLLVLVACTVAPFLRHC